MLFIEPFARIQRPFADITAPYTAIDAWAYDRFIAPAVAELLERGLGEILDGVA